MDLQSGELAELADFIDLGDSATTARAEAALAGTENWAFCAESAPDYLAQAQAFSPSDEGLLLLWAVDGTATASCGVDRVVVPWSDAAATGEDTEASTEDAAASATPVAEDINGRWCPTAQSMPGSVCVTVALPTATFDNGDVYTIESSGDLFGDGGFQFGGIEAPFGGFYPAGVPLAIPDYYSMADVPDQDRIWNSQTGVLLLRE